MTTNADTLDPHGLLAAGVEVATPPELARLLGISRRALEPLLRLELADRVRFVRTPPGRGKWRYSVDDAKAAIAPLRPALEEARRRADAQQAADEAAAATRKSELQAAHAAHVAAKDAKGAKGRPTPPTPARANPTSASSPPTSSRRHAPAVAPVVYVRRKLAAG